MEPNPGLSRRIGKSVFSGFTVLIYLFVFLCLLLVFYRYYDKYKIEKTIEVQNNLKTVAQLKAHDIESWKDERIADGRLIRRNVLLARVIERIYNNKASEKDYTDLLEIFRSYKYVYNYSSVKLIKSDGSVLVADSIFNRTSDYVLNLLPQVVSSKKTTLTDIHINDSNSVLKGPNLDLIVPFVFPGDSTIKALLTLEIDPYKYLYPLIQSWPIDSRSAETLILRNDGAGNALFLNTLKHIQNPPLSFSMKSDNKSTLAVMAVNGVRGITEGMDYRGTEVLGFIQKITDSDWIMIAKIDKDEAYAGLNQITLWFFGITFLVLIIFVYVFSYNYKKERAKHFEDMYKIESEKKTLADNYKYVFDNANDAMIMTDLDGRIIDANVRAADMYLYGNDEILGLNVERLLADEKKTKLQDYFNPVTQENGHIFETYGRKKDGSVFPVESSSRLIEINGEKYIQSIIRDITIKKKAHDLLVESEHRFATSFHNNPAWLTIVDLKTHHTIEINDAWTKAFGFTRAEAVGKTPPELGIYSKEQFDEIIKEISENKSVKNREVELTVKSGETKSMLVSRELITIYDVPYLYAMGLDITERKKAENELKSRELLFRTTLYSIGDGVITTDSKGNVQRMNAVAENLTGWKENDAEGRKLEKVFDIINEDSQEKIENPVDKVLKEGLVVGLANHTLLVSKDGKRIPIADSGAPIKTASGEIIGVVLVFRDQTEDRIKEDELRYKEYKFRSLFENTLEGISLHEIVYDKNGKAENYRILDVNDNFSKILGIEKDRAVGCLATDLYGSEKAPYLEIYSQVAETQKPYTFEVFFEPQNKYFSIAVFSPQKGMFATAFTDITDRIIASETLRLSEERYRKISSVISDIAYSYIDRKGVLELDWVTGGVEQLTGYSLDEVLKKKCWKFLVFDEDESLFLANVTGVRPGEMGKTELRIKRKNGGIVWVESYAECILEPDGNRRIYGGIIDISDKKKAAEAERERETLFSMAFRNSPNAMIIASAVDNKILDANDVMLKEMGYTRDEIQGKTSKEIGLFRNYSDRETLVKEVTEKGFARNLEIVFNTKTGEDFYGLISMSLIYLRGEPYLLSIIVNLNEIRTTEQMLKRSEEKYRRLHESITDAIIMANMDGKLIEWNAAYRDMLGYSDEELRKLTYNDITPEKWHEYEKKIVSEKILRFGDSGVYQKEYRRRDGSVLPVELRSYLIKNDEGKPFGMWAVIRDITERKKYEDALIAAKEKAEEMNRLKSNFLANMSHELRTPMTGILGFSELLYDELEDKDQKQMADVIHQGGKRLMNTLNLILNLSKLESETFSAYYSDVNLTELIVASVKMYEIMASNKNLNLTVDVESGVRASLDEQLTSQIISNLVQNAITYTNNGFVSCSLKTEISDSGFYAVIKVRDTGIGIRKEHQKIIFEPFRQVSEGFNRSYEGTGLGLTITKRYVELMNGTISVKSVPGKGSEFTVKFPLLKSNEDDKKKLTDGTVAERKPPSDKDKRILVVEDDESNAKALEISLRGIAELGFARSGEDALEMMKEDFYDLVIMDIGLPGIGGIETVKRIREKDGYKNVPVIAVTAYAMAGDREVFLSEGCSHYISKPFDVQELRDTVNKLMNG